MIAIQPHHLKPYAEVSVPGSKSYTHRILIASALAKGESRIENALLSEDTRLTMQALQQMGVHIESKPANQIVVTGTGGTFKTASHRIYLGNSGTSMRLLTAVAALGRGTFILSGTERMAERPIQALIDALEQFGVGVR
jgi:3-phosphoshikimate 1-carboxyvinyltransferase